MKVKQFFANVKDGVIKNKSTILTVAEIVGIFAAAGLTGYGAVKATKKLSEKELEWSDISDKEKRKEVIKTVAPHFIPGAATSVATSVCVIFNERSNKREIASLVTACRMSENAYSEFREACEKQFGAKKVGDVDAQIAQDYIQNNDPVVIPECRGPHKVIIKPLGIEFDSDMTKIDTAINEADAFCNDNGRISVNEFLYLLDPNIGEIAYGHDIGWEDNHKGTRVKESIKKSSVLKDGVPAIVLDFSFIHFNTLERY